MTLDDVDTEEAPFGVSVRPPHCADDTTATIAAHILRAYGLRGLRRLIKGFQRGRTCADLAPIYGVAPQRIHQWRDALGTTTRAYRIDAEIMRLAEEIDEGEGAEGDAR